MCCFHYCVDYDSQETYIPANDALKKLRYSNVPQRIFVSGETGSGKTETVKHLTQFLCNSIGNADYVRQRVIESGSIIEVFANAETVGNKNSSRFCKLIKVSEYFK